MPGAWGFKLLGLLVGIACIRRCRGLCWALAPAIAAQDTSRFFFLVSSPQRVNTHAVGIVSSQLFARCLANTA